MMNRLLGCHHLLSTKHRGVEIQKKEMPAKTATVVQVIPYSPSPGRNHAKQAVNATISQLPGTVNALLSHAARLAKISTTAQKKYTPHLPFNWSPPTDPATKITFQPGGRQSQLWPCQVLHLHRPSAHKMICHRRTRKPTHHRCKNLSMQGT